MQNKEEYLKYYDILRYHIIKQIKCDLTIRRTDNDLVPYTKNEIESYIQENVSKIDMCINEMIKDYEEDDDLESLEDPLLDWITEYLYEFIDTHEMW